MDQSDLEARQAKERERRRLLYLANRDKIRAQKRARYWAHQETENARAKRYHQELREEIIARQHRNRELHPERQKASREKYRKVHGARERALAAERYRQNPKPRRASWRKYGRRHPEKMRAKAQLRRVRQNGATGSHTVQEWQEKKALYGNRCFYCGRKMKRLTQDHLVPLSRGGSDDISNIVPACQSCNSKKHTTMVEEFLLKKVSGQINFLF